MIGGQGEKKTLRMVAQYADESNLTGEVKDIPRKLEVLAEHCERLGRDRSEIRVTKLLLVAVAPTMEEAEADLAAIAELKGWNDAVMDMTRKALIFGDADTVGERLAEAVDMGLDGITVDLPLNGHNLERVELLGQIALKALGAAS
jgi:alkanesulfonate monooxygenase SsuD/methylene tetrahydromethanopterin reductase-like flavin-dependent oxidoreductase (luciferase family)